MAGQHSDIDHSGLTGVGGSWADLDDDHDLHDHTGVPGVGGGGGASFYPLGIPYGTLERTYTFATTESWTADTGTLTANSGWLRFVSNGATNSTALEPDVGDIADGEIQMDYRFVAGLQGGVVIRATDTNNYYLVTLDVIGGANRISLYKRVAGSYTNIGTTFDGSPLRTTLARARVMVRFVGSVIDLYVNNSHFATWTDTTYTTGQTGIHTSATSTLEVDNVRVYEITTETQASPGTGDRV